MQYDVTVLAGDPAPILRNVCGAVSALFAYLIDEESIEGGKVSYLRNSVSPHTSPDDPATVDPVQTE